MTVINIYAKKKCLEIVAAYFFFGINTGRPPSVASDLRDIYQTAEKLCRQPEISLSQISTRAKGR